MKYRITIAAVLVWVAAFLQSTVLEYIEIFSVRPNLLIVMLVVIALLRSPVESAVMGLILGLLMDILTGKFLGWYALLFFLASIPISLINQKIYRDKLFILISFSFITTAVIETSFFLIIFMFGGYEHLGYVLSKIIIPEALYDGILILPLFRPLSKLYTLLDSLDRRRNRISA